MYVTIFLWSWESGLHQTDVLGVFWRITSRRSSPPTVKSRWSTCRWTASTLICPNATRTWSTSRRRRRRRPWSTWTEVCVWGWKRSGVRSLAVAANPVNAPYRSDRRSGDHRHGGADSHRSPSSPQAVAAPQATSPAPHVAPHPASHEEKVSRRSRVMCFTVTLTPDLLP